LDRGDRRPRRHPARLVDTAGLRDAHDPVEAIGVERARDLAKSADLTLYVVDSVEGLVERIARPRRVVRFGDPAIVVWNKADKPARTPIEDMAEATSRISVSAKTGAGIAELSPRRARAYCRKGRADAGGTRFG
jgi:tRNA modification GTPase